MRNISDNELDKLFQDAAQRMEPEFDPGDWDKLSKRINRSERVNLFKRIAIYLSLALLLIFSTWLGINYYQGQSDTNKNSVGDSDTIIENGQAVDSDKGDSTNNASADYTGIDADDDNGTSTSSSSEGTESSASMRDLQEGQTSSASDQTNSSSGGNADAQESKDIATGKQRSNTITSTTAEQSAEQNISRSNNAQRKSDLTTQNESTSAGTKNQNVNTVNKSAERTAVANDQQRIQKQERTVAEEKKNSDEGSLSASGNSKNQALVSANQQKKSTVNKEGESLQKNASAQNENSVVQSGGNAGQSGGNIVSTEGTNNNNKLKDTSIASDAQRLSSTSTTNTLTSDDKQKSDDVNGDIVTSENAGVAGKNNSATHNDHVNAVSQSNPLDQKTNATSPASRLTEAEKSSSDISSDSFAIADAKAKNKTALTGTNVSGNNAVIQSNNTKQNIAGADSLSTKTSELKSKDNALSAKGVSAKTTGQEQAAGAALDKSSVKRPVSGEDSLQGRILADKNVYSENKSISAHDTTQVDNDRASIKNNDTRKVAAGGIENGKVQSGDRIGSESDTLSNKADSRQKAINKATSDKGGNILLPVEKDGAQVKNSDENNAGIARQTTSPATNIPADSMSNQSVSAVEKAHEKSNATDANDSTLAKPVAKADSLDHAADNKEAAEEKKEEDKKSNESHWYAKLLVSPDFSSIGYNKPGKTGVNIGLTVEYSPSKHWGFSTGAIWSKKLYDKNNPGKAYSHGGTSFEADYLDGDCRVLDIPINITYYILPEARLNFYATVGVSSYIMLEENYVYTVTENNNNYYYYEDYKNENRHWFSMLNLSFGLQYRISPRLQLQAEPFLKAPMSGVGQGKIDLVSAGTFFTLKYKIK